MDVVLLLLDDVEMVYVCLYVNGVWFVLWDVVLGCVTYNFTIFLCLVVFDGGVVSRMLIYV